MRGVGGGDRRQGQIVGYKPAHKPKSCDEQTYQRNKLPKLSPCDHTDSQLCYGTPTDLLKKTTTTETENRY